MTNERRDGRGRPAGLGAGGSGRRSGRSEAGLDGRIAGRGKSSSKAPSEKGQSRVGPNGYSPTSAAGRQEGIHAAGSRSRPNRSLKHGQDAGQPAAAPVPVSVGEVCEIEVNGLNHEGEGVGRVSGFTLFVPGALPGERVRVRVEQLKKKYGRAALLELLRASEDRAAPPCPVYASCGGCQLQHLSYEAQLRLKQELVASNLERIGKLKTAKLMTPMVEGVNCSQDEAIPGGSEHQVLVHPVIGMDEPWRYRNKVHVPFGEREGGLVAGFYTRGTHEVADREACLIQTDDTDRIISLVKRLARELGIPAWREGAAPEGLRHVVVRTAFATGEILIVLVTGGGNLPHRERLVQALTAHVEGIAGIVLNRNPAPGYGEVLGRDMEVLWGRGVIYDRIGEIRFAISPHSFYQVNPVQTKVLYEQALAFADLSGKETVIDAYCGIGTISLFLAQRAKLVLGVEVVPEAVADARANAALNGLDNVRFEAGRAEHVLARWAGEGVRPDVVVVDPPRAGCDAALLEALIAMRPSRIVYVSCDPATLARDLRRLEDGGFRTLEVQPVDMFPHTTHIETVCSLIYKGFE